jgi:hypothetical protein
MVLNLIKRKAFWFLPGRNCVKKGVPLLTKKSNTIIKIKIGERIIKIVSEIIKSNSGLKKFL